jgi:type I restriction enzyme S subunit
MSFDWPIVHFENAPLVIIDGDRGINYPKQHEFSERGYCLFLNTGNVTTDGFKFSECAFISEEKNNLLRKGKLIRNDVVLTTRGTLGNIGFFSEKIVYENIRINSGMVILRADNKNLLPYFLYIYLRSVIFKDQVNSLKSGSAQPQLPIRDMQKIVIPIPSIRIQKDICDVIAAIDGRITLLRETNITLEAIAQALFKSWFVDFDPVRAKQDGREPEGMDAATAALFPESFEESELGLVPTGWQVSTVSKSFILTMGQSPPGDTYNKHGDGITFFQGRTDFGFRFPTPRIFCNSPTRLADVGDVLVSVRAPVGDVNMALEKCCLGRGVAGVRHPLGYSSFVFYSLRGLKSKFDQFDSEGTVFGSINKKDFKALNIIDSSNELMAAFNEISAPIDQKILVNETLVRTLIALRDTLLPRLISGELRLPGAESLIKKSA